MRIRCIGVTPLTGVEMRWQVVPVIPRPTINAESCDICGFQLAAVDMFFDGELFLCPACRSRKGKND
jgi:hypothetical protein